MSKKFPTHKYKISKIQAKSVYDQLELIADEFAACKIDYTEGRWTVNIESKRDYGCVEADNIDSATAIQFCLLDALKIEGRLLE